MLNLARDVLVEGVDVVGSFGHVGVEMIEVLADVKYCGPGVHGGVADDDLEECWSVLGGRVSCGDGVVRLIRQYHKLGLFTDGGVQEVVHLRRVLCVAPECTFVCECVTLDGFQRDQPVLINEILRASFSSLVRDIQNMVPTERLSAFPDVLQEHVHVAGVSGVLG